RSDAAVSGLDYYGARYYDPALGQFTSADSQAAGLNRYGYVKGNPETFTDPTGHMACSADFGACVAPTHYTGHKREVVPGPKAGDHGGGKGGNRSTGGGGGVGTPTPTPKPATSGDSDSGTCDKECQDATREGQTDIDIGIFKTLGSLALMAGACWIE